METGPWLQVSSDRLVKLRIKQICAGVTKITLCDAGYQPKIRTPKLKKNRIQFVHIFGSAFRFHSVRYMLKHS